MYPSYYNQFDKQPNVYNENNTSNLISMQYQGLNNNSNKSDLIDRLASANQASFNNIWDNNNDPTKNQSMGKSSLPVENLNQK